MPIELQNESLRVEIHPEFGGMVNRFLVKKGSDEINIIYGYDSSDDIYKQIREDFRGVNLSPYPNRIKEGEYKFEEETYQLDLNFPQEGNSIHGFLFDQLFQVTLQTPTHLILKYAVEENSVKGYPFSYEYTLDYVLLDKKLVCNTFVKNLSNSSIPIANGFHPYFQLGNDIDELELRLPLVEKLEVDDDMIPTGKFSSFTYFNEFEKLKGVQLDTGFKIKEETPIPETILRNDFLELSIKQDLGDRGYNYLQVYTPPHRQAIAIEPMSGAANCFNNGLGLITLWVNEELKLSYSIEVNIR